MSRRARVAGLAALALLVPPAVPASAQDEPFLPPEQSSVRITVASMTAVVGPGARPTAPDAPPPADFTARVLVENDGDTSLDNLRLVVEPFGRVDTRSELRLALSGGDVAAPQLRPTGVDVREGGTLSPGEIAGVTVTVPAAQGDWTGDTSHVHPVQLTVVRGTEELDQLRTAVVYLADPPTGLLETAFVWPLDEAPWRGAAGVHAPDADASIRADGRLDRLLAAAERASTSGILLAPAAHLVEDLRDRADGFPELRPSDDGTEGIVTVPSDDPAAQRAAAFLARLRELVAALPRAPVAGPYADADVGGLVAGSDPLPDLAADAALQGRRRLQPLLDRQPDPSVYLATTPLTAAALDVIPGDHLLLPWEHVSGPDLLESPAADIPYPLRQTRAPAGRQLTATVADPWITGLLDTPDLSHGSVVAAHRVAVETAIMFLRAPGVEGRPLLVLPPLDWDPEPRFADLVLSELIGAPWVRLTDPSAQLSRSSSNPRGLQLAAGDRPLAPDLARDLQVARRQLDAALAALPDDVSTIGDRRPETLIDQLLRAPSVWHPPGSDRARALVRDVQSAIDTTFGEVEVPRTASITLTSDRGTIPVTLQRTEGGPLRVRVEVESQGRLTWPEGESQEVTLTPDSTQTVSFETRALSRGTFLVAVTVRDPNGERIIERTSLSVRSTAISRPALAVTGVIVVLLLLRGLFRRKTDREPRLEVVRS